MIDYLPSWNCPKLLIYDILMGFLKALYHIPGRLPIRWGFLQKTVFRALILINAQLRQYELLWSCWEFQSRFLIVILHSQYIVPLYIKINRYNFGYEPFKLDILAIFGHFRRRWTERSYKRTLNLICRDNVNGLWMDENGEPGERAWFEIRVTYGRWRRTITP